MHRIKIQTTLEIKQLSTSLVKHHRKTGACNSNIQSTPAQSQWAGRRVIKATKYSV